MTIFIVLLSIIILVLLITWVKLNAFLALLLVSIFAGLFLGIPLDGIAHSLQKGIGDTLGSLVIIISLGAMLGKLVAESGAAQKPPPQSSVAEMERIKGLLNLRGEKSEQSGILVDVDE